MSDKCPVEESHVLYVISDTHDGVRTDVSIIFLCHPHPLIK